MLQPGIVIDESISGYGFSGTAGLGYTYVMQNRVGFEVGFNYRLSSINAKVTDHTVAIEANQTFTRADIMFSFGFIVLFNRIRK